MGNQISKGRLIAALADQNLITATSAGNYLTNALQSTLSKKQMTALRTVELLDARGQSIDLATLRQMTLIFKNDDQLEVSPAAIAAVIFKPSSVANGKLSGFGVVLKRDFQQARLGDSPETIFRRLSSHQDLKQIQLTTNNGDLITHEIEWSPMSDPTDADVNQQVAQIDRAVIVYGLTQSRYSMVEAVKAALIPANLNQIVTEFRSENPDRSAAEVNQIMTAQLHEMLKAADDHRQSSQKDELLVDRVALNKEDKESLNSWDPVLYELKSGEKYAGINLESYESLMAMNVRIPKGNFWQGFTWLLWEISFYGIDTKQRQQAIDQAKRNLQQRFDEIAEFEKATQQMKRFIDWYVKKHIQDQDLPNFVEKYWPLTQGRQEKLFDDDEPVFVMEQDPQLLNEFMANYGAAYYQLNQRHGQ